MLLIFWNKQRMGILFVFFYFLKITVLCRGVEIRCLAMAKRAGTKIFLKDWSWDYKTDLNTRH
jgi:hypothetical protein